MICTYPDTARFYKVTSSGYGNTKIVEDSEDVPFILLQNTSFARSQSQEGVESDAVGYPDPDDSFISGNFNRLEGMYLMCTPYGASSAVSWYKVISVTVNRDHLLCADIDNIQLSLKKTEALPGVS